MGYLPHTGLRRDGFELPAFDHAHEIGAAEIIAVLHAIARVYELLGEDLHHVFLDAAFEAAEEIEVQDFGVIVLEHHVLDVDALEFLLVFRALLDVPVEFAILCDGMTPKLPSTTGFLANLKFDALLFFVLRQLHVAGS